MNEKLKVGIIGAGGIARGIHIPNYLKHSDRVEIIAVADVIEKNAKECGEKFSIPQVFTDYKEMLAQCSLDAVSVCTPNKFHAEASIHVLEAGCHVLCEKPPAMNVEEAKAMEEAAERNGKILTYGFHFRYAPEVQALKRFTEGGALGNIYAATIKAVRRRGIPGWGVFTNKELQGGGPLIDIGVHMLDTALYLMDYPEPETVFGATYQEIGTRKGVGTMGEWDWKNFSIEDMALGMIRFKNGATVMLETAFAANVEKNDLMNVSLMGNEGGADVFPLKIYQEKYDTLIDISPAYLPKKGYHELEVETFVNACLANESPLSTPAQGVVIQKIINGLYESARTGEAVKLDE
ncbi:Gfo/Idh/MocA family protein [Halobacillus dabanensis]|uniref:Gfo/Idh/MocA family protein n=1 Tax=Halobacillus dabanensis TaxID=240302 RepID=UPI000944F704|nr:Gfo/Idh/MocA family oxidoreductase [Halobacillus dabanensis]